MFKRRAPRPPGRPLAPGLILAMGLLVLAAALPLAWELPLSISVYLALAVGLRLAALRYPRLLAGRLPLLLLTLGGVALVLGHFRTLLGYEAGIALFALMLALKLWEMASERDLQVAALLALFFLVMQLLLDQSMYRGAWLLLVLVGILAVLGAQHRQVPRGWRAELRQALALVAQALPLVLLLFLLFPRLSAPLWKLDLGKRGLTGLGDQMEPGSISELIQSEEPAFRVEFSDAPPPPAQRYWRGPVLWHYDGRRWTAAKPGRQEQPPRLVSHGPPVQYRMILEPHGKTWLFPLDLPAAPSGEARLGADFQLLARRPLLQKTPYQGTSYLEYRTDDPDPEQARAALQLPPNISPRARDLVENWRRAETDPAALARRALALFREEPFVYTLKPPLLLGDPLEDFLFRTRAGFCEHYASAFSLLMRLAGIPSRVVTGYQGGEFNPVGGYLLVRQLDAHAWSEIWLAGRGWVRVDPTAAIAPERIERRLDLEPGDLGEAARFVGAGGWLGQRLAQRLGFALDALNTRWHLWVLNYDRERQNRLLDWIGLGGLGRHGLGLILVAGSLTLLVLLTLGLRGRQPDPREPAQILYQRFLARLARAGIPLRPEEGPRDLGERTRRLRPDLAPETGAILDLYIRIRYRNLNQGPDLERLARLIRGFRPRV